MIGRFLSWLRRPPTRRVPETLWQDIVAAHPFLACLDAEENARLYRLTGDFLAEKEFSSAGGLELDDRICVSIAAQGCLPVLNLGLGCYRGWVGIVIYPDEFVIPRSVEDEFGVVHEYDDIAAGEAWAGGPLLISWRDAQMAGSGYNVVIHEFAHKLDMLNGEPDGIPPLPDGTSRKLWRQTLLAAYDDFCVHLDAADENGSETLLDPYAAENPGEFFAVMSEVFFEDPRLLHGEYPALYDQLAIFYRQNPLNRLPATTG